MEKNKIILEGLTETLDELIDADSVDVSSLVLQDTLNPEIWIDMKLKDDIRRKLLDIANDFYKDLSIPKLYLSDIYFLGSMASYNWNQYSDIDLHLIIDFSSYASDDDIEFLEDYFQSKKKIWNDKHDIRIKGYEVEIYVQDEGEVNASNGVYSLITGSWIQQPKKDNPDIPYTEIKKKTSAYMNAIDEMKSKFENGEYKTVYDGARVLKEKVIKMRRSGLEKTGEYGIENLTFKLLRRLGYIDLLTEIIDKSYDENMGSLKEAYVSGSGQYIEKDHTPDELKALRPELLEAVQSYKNSDSYKGTVTWYDPSSGFDHLSANLLDTLQLILSSKNVGLDSELLIDATEHHMIPAVVVSTTEGKYVVTIKPNALFVYDENGYLQGINKKHRLVVEDIQMYPLGEPPQ